MIPIDALTAIFADYASQIGFPPDAKPVKWMLNPQECKLMLVVEAESLNGDAQDEEIRFTLRQTHLVS